MTIKFLLLGYRLPNVSPAEFKKYYEEHHLPMIKSMAGDHLFFKRHTRTYVARSDDAAAGYPAISILGNPDDFQYDVVVELEFRDEEHFQTFVAWTETEPNKGIIEGDETKFFDRARSKIVRLGETLATTA